MDCAIAGARHQLKTRQPSANYVCTRYPSQGRAQGIPKPNAGEISPQSASLLVLVLGAVHALALPWMGAQMHTNDRLQHDTLLASTP